MGSRGTAKGYAPRASKAREHWTRGALRLVASDWCLLECALCVIGFQILLGGALDQRQSGASLQRCPAVRVGALQLVFHVFDDV